MMIEIERDNIFVVFQYLIKVLFEGKIVGEYFTDILVDDKIIVEIKVVRSISIENETQ